MFSLEVEDHDYWVTEFRRILDAKFIGTIEQLNDFLEHMQRVANEPMPNFVLSTIMEAYELNNLYDR